MSAATIRIEPPRFAMTGAGIVFSVPFEFYDDVMGYSLDAPEFIARGGLRTRDGQTGSIYVFTTEARA
jgi:hypothetical protein